MSVIHLALWRGVDLADILEKKDLNLQINKLKKKFRQIGGYSLKNQSLALMNKQTQRKLFICCWPFRNALKGFGNTAFYTGEPSPLQSYFHR